MENWIRDPSIIIDKRKHNLKLQFDMFHGYGKIQKAANLLPEPENKKFIKYLDTKTEFNPNIMVISKKKILEKWFKDVFEWLENCEKIFGFKNLQGYDTGRLYAYLAERYLSFWFNSKCNSTTGPWTFLIQQNKSKQSNLSILLFFVKYNLDNFHLMKFF